MASLAGIREGLAANLGSLKGCQVSAYVLPNPTPPTIEVYPDAAEGTEYHQAMRNGLHIWRLAVRGMVSVNDGVGAQMKLDEWLADTGASSVFAALESDTTLGGLVAQVVVRGHSGYQEYARDGLEGSVLAVVWNVDVFAAGN